MKSNVVTVYERHLDNPDTVLIISWWWTNGGVINHTRTPIPYDQLPTNIQKRVI